MMYVGSVSANDNNESAFNSLPSIFKTPENEEKEVPPPQPITNDVGEEELKPVENVSIPVAEPAVVEQTQQEPEQLEEKATEEVEENKPAQGGYKKDKAKTYK